MKFKRLMDHQWVDVKEYVTNYLIENEDIIVYVGCDSQLIGGVLKYATCIVLYKKGRGGHVLYKAERSTPIREMKLRLLGEVQRSIDVASYLKYECGIDVKSIEIDINQDKRFKSNVALTEAVGYVMGMGFSVKCKPEVMCSVRAANLMCR